MISRPYVFYTNLKYLLCKVVKCRNVFGLFVLQVQTNYKHDGSHPFLAPEPYVAHGMPYY